MRGWVAGSLVLLVLVSLAVPVAAEPRVVEVYPDPYADGDGDELVAVEFDGSPGNWSLGDGEDQVPLPDSPNGTVYFVDGDLPPCVQANQSVLVQQAYIDSWDDRQNPYLSAVLDRARAGVEVRVLLDGRWFNREENQAVVDRFNGTRSGRTSIWRRGCPRHRYTIRES